MRNEKALKTIIKSIAESVTDEVLTKVLQLDQNLDSRISLCFSDSIREGENSMASKFKERVKIGVNSDGSPVYTWACGKTKEELHRSIAAILSGNVDAIAKDTPVWRDYAMDWFKSVHLPRIRAKTAEKESSLFKNHIVQAFPGKRLDQIDSKMVQDFLATKSHYSRCQVRDIMGLMGQIFKCAVEDDLIAKNPMDSSRVFNTSQKAELERRPLTRSEQADIIAHLEDLTEPNARRLMALLMFTPLRPCEIYGLKWEDIDADKKILQVKRDLVFVRGKGIVDSTKTEESARPIPFDDQLLEYLKPIKKDGFVICMSQIGREGEHVSSDSVIRSLWRRIGKVIDLHGMTPYTGRHTFATNMSRAGVPIKTAMSYMGHTDERMLLRRYTHVEDSDLINANRTMSEYIGGLSKSLLPTKIQDII